MANAPKSDPFLAGSEANFYWTATNCCGLVATYLVCHDLGRPVALRDLSRELPVTSKGTSMDDVAACLRANRLIPTGLRLSAASLHSILESHPEQRAIIAMRSNHWVMVRTAGLGHFAVFDYPNWSLVPIGELAERFENVALIVSSADDNSILPGLSFDARRESLRMPLCVLGVALVCAGIVRGPYRRIENWIRPGKVSDR